MTMRYENEGGGNEINNEIQRREREKELPQGKSLFSGMNFRRSNEVVDIFLFKTRQHVKPMFMLKFPSQE